MSNLSSRVAIVTGAGGGLGRATAVALARAGASVMVTDIEEARAHETAKAIHDEGGSAFMAQHDVSDEDRWRAVLAQATDQAGPCTILVNNAGINVLGSVEDIAFADFERVMRVNAGGVLLGMKTLIPHMRETGGGSIINLSSTTALVQSGMTAAYGASKAAIANLTKAAALHCAQARDGVRVNALLPGPIASGMGAAMDDGTAQGRAIMDWMTSLVPLGRLGTAEDVARAVLWLASDESSFATGSSLVLDGGFTAQ